MVTKICKRCGKEFTTEKNAQKFCSNRCCNNYHHLGAKQTEFTCAYCGKQFTSSIKKKYCSVDCRERLYRQERKKARKKPKSKNFKSLVEVAIASREAGLSYGQYVAKMGL